VLTVCATVVVAAGLAVVWVRVVQTLTESSGGPQTVGQPGALVWDGRVFTTARQLKAYLAARDLSYSRWAARHPTAFGGHAPTVIKHTTKKAAKPATHHVAAPTVSDTKSRTITTTLLTVLLLLGGVALAGSAVIPPRYAPLAVARFYADPGRRTVALAAAAAVLLGFGVSFYLN
jgi:hypothetical protein